MHRETKLKNFFIPVKSIDSIPLDYNLFNISITLLQVTKITKQIK